MFDRELSGGHPPRRLAMCRIARLTAIALAVVGLVHLPSPADPPQASQQSPAPGPLRYAIHLTDAEQRILDSVRDRDRQLDEPGFYMMLHHVSRMPALSEPQLQQLDRPAVVNLLREPQHYRARPLRLMLTAKIVRKLVPGEELTPTRWWDKTAGAVWRMDCLARPDEQTRADGGNPVIVFCTSEPSALGEPQNIASDGALEYPSGRNIELSGVFYKVHRDVDRDGNLRDYPVVLASGVRLRSGSLDEFRTLLQGAIIIALAVVLLVVFYLLKRRAKRSARVRPAARRGFEAPRTQRGEGDEGAVDPRLKAAARRFREQRSTDENGSVTSKDRG